MTIEQFELTEKYLRAFSEYCQNHECTECKVIELAPKEKRSCFDRFCYVKEQKLI